MKYKKKPVVIEAVKWNGDKISEVTDWISKALDRGVIMDCLSSSKCRRILRVILFRRCSRFRSQPKTLS